MQTQRVEISPSEWTEIAHGSENVLMDIGIAEDVLMHFSNTDNAPDIDAPAHRINSWTRPFDLERMGMVSGQRVWVKSIKEAGYIVVTREVDVFIGFIPDQSDSLITVNGLTFKSKE